MKKILAHIVPIISVRLSLAVACGKRKWLKVHPILMIVVAAVLGLFIYLLYIIDIK